MVKLNLSKEKIKDFFISVFYILKVIVMFITILANPSV